MEYRLILLALSMVFTVAIGCESDDPVADKPDPIVEEKIKLFPNLVADSLTWDIAIKELNTTIDAEAGFNRWITKTAAEGMVSPLYSVSKMEGSVPSAVNKNTEYIYSLAVRWLFMDDKETDKAERYLQKVTTLIQHWAVTNEPVSHTPNESLLTPIYEAYSIIRNHIGDNERKEIDTWIRMRANFYKNLNLTGNLLENNWNTIRINFLFYFAQILDDEMLYNYSVSKLKSHIELNILENGISHDFVNRDAFAYHAYNLLFYSRILKAVAMYKGNEEAVKLYQMKNSKGSSIESCVQFWEPYLIDPANNVHLEFVNTGWEPDKDKESYNKPYNPAGTIYVLDELRYIEPKCTDYIDAISSTNRYGRTFRYWINSVE